MIESHIVKTVWEEMPASYPGVGIDAFVVMPNHIHGIIVLVGADPHGRPDALNPPVSASMQGNHL